MARPSSCPPCYSPPMSDSSNVADFVAVEAAGKLAGISPRTLRHWIATGKLPAIPGKRGKLVRLEEVRRRAEVAEAEAAGLRLRLAEASVPALVVVAGQDATEASPATATASDAHSPVQGLWRRLRRAWRGR